LDSAGIIVFIAGLIAIALIIPILLDESPTAFIENGLCTIFAGGGNTTCGSVLGNVTFIGDFPIFITPDFANNTITWSLGSLGNASHVNIGGGAEVFKNETAGLSTWRTLEGGGGVTVTQFNQTIEIRTGGGGAPPLSNINNGSGQVFSSAAEGDTVTFVGQGIAISNVSSVTFTLNATADELLDVQYPTPPDERDILIWNVTTMMFENKRLDDILIPNDVHFNAEESTVDDLTGVDCVNDVTYSIFSNLDIHQYRRQAVEFCSDSDPDDNLTWLYAVPKDFTGGTDFNFKLFWTDDDTSQGSFMKRVDDDDDDAEESIGPINLGDVSLGSTDLEMHAENIVEADDNDLIGMRWTNVTIPNGATIINATIQFHVDSTDPDEPIIVRFKGHDIDDAPQFTSTDFDISSRTNTTAFVDWDIPDWENTSDEGPAQETPNLATIVQEIVDRAGWVSGNAMVIKTTEWIDCTVASCPVNFGERHAESHDGEASSAPQLKVFWSTTGGAAPVCFEFSLLALQNTEDLDGDFVARQTTCVNRSGSDQLSVTEFITDSVDHELEPEDLVFFRIHRPDNFVPNDYESDIFVFGGELQWLN